MRPFERSIYEIPTYYEAGRQADGRVQVVYYGENAHTHALCLREYLAKEKKDDWDVDWHLAVPEKFTFIGPPAPESA